jgi:putative flippase GtrA
VAHHTPPQAGPAEGSSESSQYARLIVQRLRHFLFVRHLHNWRLFFRFGLVGGSGVLVNMLVVILCHKMGPNENGVFFDLPLTDYNVRWYHVYSTIAFVGANLWNFQLNRRWTFESHLHANWFREYFPFLAVGLLGQLVGLGILTLLMHPGSMFSLPTAVFDDSTGFRTRLYWAQLITIAIVTPLSFVLNKLWTFSAVRGKEAIASPQPAPDPEHSDITTGAR